LIVVGVLAGRAKTKNDGPIEVTVGERAASPPALQSFPKCGVRRPAHNGATTERFKAQRAALGYVTSPVWELAAPGEPVLRWRVVRGFDKLSPRTTVALRQAQGAKSAGRLDRGGIPDSHFQVCIH